MVKTYEYRKFFRFRHTKLFDVTDEGLLYEGKLYVWSEIRSLTTISRPKFSFGFVNFNDGKVCKFVLNTFRERGKANECFLGINPHFDDLENLIYANKKSERNT